VKKLLKVNFDVQFLPILSFEPAIMADKPHIEIFSKLLPRPINNPNIKIVESTYCLY
jgi:hypothetical protein